MLDKTFDPAAAEPRLYAMWEDSGVFAPRDATTTDGAADAYSIVIPPPNVTGSLHIGHALNNTLQDILARYHRMKGKAVLWLPGTDHAGIATQMVVERQLAAAGNVSRRDMGRDAFVDKIWEWKATSAGAIQNQLRRLGSSCDWSRERFTLDPTLQDAVRKVFVQLHKEGLIYRDKRLVNWDPHFQTAISDLEVEQREMDGAYWHFAYPLADGVTYEHPVAWDGDGQPTEYETRDYIVVATTRPETMLGDTGVAVHPEDPRYQGLVGQFVMALDGHVERFDEAFFRHDLLAFDGQADVADVKFGVHELGEQHVGGVLMNDEAGVGVGFLKLADGVAQEVRPQGGDDADGDMTFGGGVAVGDGGVCLLHVGEDAAGTRVENLADFGEKNAAPQTVE